MDSKLNLNLEVRIAEDKLHFTSVFEVCPGPLFLVTSDQMLLLFSSIKPVQIENVLISTLSLDVSVSLFFHMHTGNYYLHAYFVFRYEDM